ncbi:MAG: hypothetical protein ACERKK_02355 [Poseidonibacter sp.]|uniref:hypothetical protein n=1 Tax=Poseidonibacter sp. TaxID=2321188 RepID=UPI00359E7F5E
MSLNSKSINEILELALRTTSLEDMLTLLQNSSMNVRRALARNINITEEILQVLLIDPVQNVAYMANQHPKNKVQKDFGDVRPCVSCKVAENNLNCSQCPRHTAYSY